ncbi:B3/4 domain-containing protein [Chlamydiota bacterium]
MLFSIDDKIFENYPQTEIGYLVAQVCVRKSDPFVENLKCSLQEHLLNQGINPTNFVAHPSLAIWRKIYEENFGVKPKTYRSSIESLIRRVVTGKGIWNICNIVDLYNCCSILSLLPMGGYDLNKIVGDVKIRYAEEGETFLGLGEKEKIQTLPNHIVYSDDQRILCWLWNHKDSAETCIDEDSKSVVFFIDAFEHNSVLSALKLLAENLRLIQSTILEAGILNKSSRYSLEELALKE